MQSASRPEREAPRLMREPARLPPRSRPNSRAATVRPAGKTVYDRPMRCLDRTLLPSSLAVSLAWLALAGCSDDGLAPPQETDAASSTGAVSTSPTTGEDTGIDPSGLESTGGGTTAASDSVGMETGTGPADGTTDGTTGEAPPPSMPCQNANECVLVDNCCECAAHHMDDEIPVCELECDQTVCASLGIPHIGLVCEDMMCGFETHDCSGITACDSLPPECPEGTLPEVGPGGGGCWTGACIPIAACDPLPSCDYCDETEACVAMVTQQGAMYSCQALPEECMGTATCECLPDACQAPFDACADADGQITCECPAC